MEYININEVAREWKVSERTARHYCAQRRVEGAILEGKTWKVPKGAEKPARKQKQGKLPTDLLTRLKAERSNNTLEGIYHKVQIEFAYNSNGIDGKGLSREQVHRIFENNTVTVDNDNSKDLNVDDIIETANHFSCVDMILDQVKYKLSENLIKQLHWTLKAGTQDSRKFQFPVGEYKRIENRIAEKETAKPDNVPALMKKLLDTYNDGRTKNLEDIVQFHYLFERIHPFQNGNGRIGRLIMFKECLRNGINPFVIEEQVKEFYFRGLRQWPEEKGYLMDTCYICQDKFEEYLREYGIIGKK